jgi:hypothetical protein
MGSMKNRDLLLAGGALLAGYLIYTQIKKKTDVVGAVSDAVNTAQTDVQAGASDLIGTLTAALARLLPTNTAGGTINMGSTGTGAVITPAVAAVLPVNFVEDGSWQNWVHDNYTSLLVSNPGIVDPGAYVAGAAKTAYDLQQAAYAAAAIGTPGIQAPEYTPNATIATTNGNYIQTDSSGYVVHDSSAIINQGVGQQAYNAVILSGGSASAAVEATRQAELASMNRHD